MAMWRREERKGVREGEKIEERDEEQKAGGALGMKGHLYLTVSLLYLISELEFVF